MARTPQEIYDSAAKNIAALELDGKEALQVTVTEQQRALVEQINREIHKMHVRVYKIAKEIPDARLRLGGK